MPVKYLIYLVIFSFVACSTEMYLSVPGFPAMAESFKTTEAQIQATLSMNLLAICLASILTGSLSDSLGRRKVLIGGFLLFCVCSAACIFCNSLNSLLIFRFLQGTGASVIWVVSYAIIADLAPGSDSVKYISLLSAISTLAIAMSPTIGSILCKYFGWRATFACTTILSVFAFITLLFVLPETSKQRSKLQPRTIAHNYVKLLKSYQYMLHAFTPSILQIPYIIFISCAPFLYMTILKLPYEVYGIHQSTVIAAYSLSAFNFKRMQNYFGEIELQKIGLSLIAISTIAIVPLVITHPTNPFIVTICMSMAFVGMAICFCRVVPKTLAVFPEMRASAAALMMASRWSLCACGTLLGGYFYTGNIKDSITLISVTMGIGLIFHYLTIKAADPHKLDSVRAIVHS